jgi:hypothetical protein
LYRSKKKWDAGMGKYKTLATWWSYIYKLPEISNYVKNTDKTFVMSSEYI